MYDIIGDIHGYADQLEALLQKMGYTLQDGVYSHPSRTVVFVGDYIDRGPQIRETLAIVKAMADSGNAVAIMGNHEYNALCYYHEHPQGGHLRRHTIKNRIQYFETIKQFQNREAEYEMYINWMMTLPLYYENEHFRVVHACWDAITISYLRSTLENDRLNKTLLIESADKNTSLYEAVEIALKGKEIALPNGLSFKDKDGIARHNIRIKWWENAKTATYKTISVLPLDTIPERAIESSVLAHDEQYPATDKPVFFGHYWLKGKPQLLESNVCCTDYSVAKEGLLVAYRYDGEQVLEGEKFCY